jgi:hypothetical protein
MYGTVFAAMKRISMSDDVGHAAILKLSDDNLKVYDKADAADCDSDMERVLHEFRSLLVASKDKRDILHTCLSVVKACPPHLAAKVVNAQAATRLYDCDHAIALAEQNIRWLDDTMIDILRLVCPY